MCVVAFSLVSLLLLPLLREALHLPSSLIEKLCIEQGQRRLAVLRYLFHLINYPLHCDVG